MSIFGKRYERKPGLAPLSAAPGRASDRATFRCALGVGSKDSTVSVYVSEARRWPSLISLAHSLPFHWRRRRRAGCSPDFHETRLNERDSACPSCANELAARASALVILRRASARYDIPHTACDWTFSGRQWTINLEWKSGIWPMLRKGTEATSCERTIHSAQTSRTPPRGHCVDVKTA